MPVNYSLGKIYTIVNSINDAVYVGSTAQKTLAVRMAQHRSKAKIAIDASPFHLAMRTVGIGCFKIVLHHCFSCQSKDELEAEEFKVVMEYDQANVPIYNTHLTKRGWKLTEETKAKITIASTGRFHSDESKAKMSIVQTGRICSDESKARMSIAQTGRICSIETKAKLSIAMIGRPISDETKLKIAAAQIGRLNHSFAFGGITYKIKGGVEGSWRFCWSPKVNRESSKSFSCKKYGFWQAKLLAETHRRTIYPEWKSDEEIAINSLYNIDIE